MQNIDVLLNCPMMLNIVYFHWSRAAFRSFINKGPQIARFMGPTWGPSGAGRTQVGPMLAPWTLLSGAAWPLKTDSNSLMINEVPFKKNSSDTSMEIKCYVCEGFREFWRTLYCKHEGTSPAKLNVNVSLRRDLPLNHIHGRRCRVFWTEPLWK